MSGNASTPFANAGLTPYRGDDTLQGVSTTTVQGQPPAKPIFFTGTYTVSLNCYVREVDTDQTDAVYHYDEYTGPLGSVISFIETDPNIVSSGTETRDWPAATRNG